MGRCKIHSTAASTHSCTSSGARCLRLAYQEGTSPTLPHIERSKKRGAGCSLPYRTRPPLFHPFISLPFPLHTLSLLPKKSLPSRSSLRASSTPWIFGKRKRNFNLLERPFARRGREIWRSTPPDACHASLFCSRAHCLPKHKAPSHLRFSDAWLHSTAHSLFCSCSRSIGWRLFFLGRSRRQRSRGLAEKGRSAW
jgi:hypothetical protein